MPQPDIISNNLNAENFVSFFFLNLFRSLRSYPLFANYQVSVFLRRMEKNPRIIIERHNNNSLHAKASKFAWNEGSEAILWVEIFHRRRAFNSRLHPSYSCSQ